MGCLCTFGKKLRVRSRRRILSCDGSSSRARRRRARPFSNSFARFVPLAGGFHEKDLPTRIDCSLGRFAERLEVESPSGERHEEVEGLLTGALASVAMYDLSLLDENMSPQFLGGDFEHRRTAGEAFHLKDILQTDT